jgi:SAM-dependent methyltransferase
MGTATINGELWGARAEPWSRIQEGQVLPLYEAVFEAVGLTSGTALLDAGCGSGLALQLATKRGAVGTGLDASEALIDIAHRRMPHADLRVGELEELPYPEDSFDVATAFNSVQYAGDPGRALSELARVVRPGGLVAVATWGQPQDCQITAVLGAVLPLMPPQPPDAPHEGPFALSEPGRLESFVSAAGLEPVSTREVDCPMHYSDVETALRGQESPGVLVMAARHAGEQVVAEALRGSLGQFVQADGSVRIANTFRFIIARAGGRSHV